MEIINSWFVNSLDNGSTNVTSSEITQQFEIQKKNLYWRQETPHPKRCITCYMNILHVRKCGLSWFLFAPHLITYWKFGSVFKIFQNWGGPTILKVALCTHDTNVFATKFRKILWKLVLNHKKKIKTKQKWKTSRRNNDNDVRTFVMLKYGRNEKMMFCVFIGHERQKLFWGNHYFH